MGDSIEQWRATIGQWSGGGAGQCVTLHHCTAQSSNRIGYRQIRFLVLLSLLVIGCVELNPGPDHVRSLIHSNKYLCRFCREHYETWMKEKTRNKILTKRLLIMVGNFVTNLINIRHWQEADTITLAEPLSSTHVRLYILKELWLFKYAVFLLEQLASYTNKSQCCEFQNLNGRFGSNHVHLVYCTVKCSEFVRTFQRNLLPETNSVRWKIEIPYSSDT